MTLEDQKDSGSYGPERELNLRESESDPTEYRKQSIPLIDFMQYILSSNLFFNRLQSP